MDNKKGANDMTNLTNAVIRQIEALQASAAQIPECAEEYQNMAWGVFGLWMDLAGYQPTDENEQIAMMRDYCTNWGS